MIMKKIIFFTITGAALFLGCTKTIPDYKADFNYAGSGGNTFLKINFVSLYRSNPSVQLNLNGVRVSNLITARTPFPGGGLNTGGNNLPDYLNLPFGINNISVSIPKKNTNEDSVLLFSTSTGYLIGGKSYTLHITDTALATRTAIVEDNRTIIDTGIVEYNFVNLMPNAPRVDLYYGTEKLAAAVGYLQSAKFVMRPTGTLAAWTTRETGSTATLATIASGSTNIPLTIAKGRIFTVFACGYKGITSTTDPRRPFVSFIYNK